MRITDAALYTWNGWTPPAARIHQPDNDPWSIGTSRTDRPAPLSIAPPAKPAASKES